MFHVCLQNENGRRQGSFLAELRGNQVAATTAGSGLLPHLVHEVKQHFKPISDLPSLSPKRPWRFAGVATSGLFAGVMRCLLFAC